MAGLRNNRPTEVQIQAVLVDVNKNNFPGMSRRVAAFSGMIFMGALMGVAGIFTPKAVHNVSVNYARNNGSLLPLSMNNALNINEFKKAGKSLLSAKRKQAEIAANTALTTLYWAQFVALFKISKTSTLIGLGTKSAVVAKAVAAVSPITLAVTMYTAAAFQIRAYRRASRKTDPAYLLNDRLDKLDVLLNRNKKPDAHKNRLLNQAVSLDYFSGKHSENNIARIEQSGMFPDYKRPNKTVRHRLATHLIDKQKQKKEVALTKATVLTTVGVGFSLIALAKLGIAIAGISFPPVAIAMLTSAAMFGVYKGFQAYFARKDINRVLNASIKALANSGDEKVINTINDIEEKKKQIENLENRLSSTKGHDMVLTRFRLSKNEREGLSNLKNEIKQAKKELATQQNQLESIAKQTIVKKSLGLSEEQNINDFVTSNDVNKIVANYVSHNADLVNALKEAEKHNSNIMATGIVKNWERDFAPAPDSDPSQLPDPIPGVAGGQMPLPLVEPQTNTPIRNMQLNEEAKAPNPTEYNGESSP